MSYAIVYLIPTLLTIVILSFAIVGSFAAVVEGDKWARSRNRYNSDGSRRARIV